MVRNVKPSGFISLGALTASLALVALAIGGIYYLLFGIHGKQLSSYDDVTKLSTNESVRYSIKKISLDNHTPEPSFTTDKRTQVFKKEDKLTEHLPQAPAATQPNGQSSGRPDNQLGSQPDIQLASPANTQPSDPLDANVVNLTDDRDIIISDNNAHSTSYTSDDRIDPVTSIGKSHLYVIVPVGRVRQAASEQAAIKARVYNGERVEVVADKGPWIQIHTDDGRNGWAHEMLFSKNAPSLPEERKAGLNSGLIKNIHTKNLTEEGCEILIELNDYCLPNTSVIKGDRPRVVSDFYGVLPVSTLEKRIVVNQGIILSIRLGVHSGDRSKTRVVVDLLAEHEYIVEQQFLIAENIYQLKIHL